MIIRKLVLTISWRCPNLFSQGIYSTKTVGAAISWHNRQYTLLRRVRNKTDDVYVAGNK